MEAFEVAQQLQDICVEQEKLNAMVSGTYKKKSEAFANYDRAIAKTIASLRNGVEFEIDGEKIVNPPVSNIEKLAKGICWKEHIEAGVSEANVKGLESSLKTARDKLTATMSINKYLSVT